MEQVSPLISDPAGHHMKSASSEAFCPPNVHGEPATSSQSAPHGGVKNTDDAVVYSKYTKKEKRKKKTSSATH